jgi:hypothetical protein
MNRHTIVTMTAAGLIGLCAIGGSALSQQNRERMSDEQLMETIRKQVEQMSEEQMREAVEQSLSNAVQSLSKMAAGYQKIYLMPILEDLKSRAASDKRLSALLGKLELRIIPFPRPMSRPPTRYPVLPLSPNAIATFDQQTGRPVIYVDVIFLDNLEGVADFGGLLLTGINEVTPVIGAVRDSYARLLAQAKMRGEPAPPFEFKLSAVNLKRGLDVMASRFSSEVRDAGFAWMMLHEVAHHVLHFDREPPQSKKDQQSLELEADIWAFDMMENLGYGLASVRAALTALEFGEQLRSRAGFGQPESDSDHPSWSTRRKQLEALHDTSLPPHSRLLDVVTLIGDDIGGWLIQEFFVPRDPDDGDVYAFVRYGNQPLRNLAFEWIAREVHIYGRDATNYSEIVIADPGSLYPRISARHTPVTGGPEMKSTTKGFEASMTPKIQGWGEGALSGRDIVSTSPRAAIATVLAATPNLDSKARSAAEQVVMEPIREARQIMVGYAKGLLSPSAAASQVEALHARTRVRLSKLLGQDALSRFDQTLLANPLMQLSVPPSQPR